MIPAVIKNTFRRPHLESDRSDAAPKIGPKMKVNIEGKTRGTKPLMFFSWMYLPRTSRKSVSNNLEAKREAP